ncbi:hypothetical protein lerEdw1_009567 [Lerista edwardsae]|nr:hypothetical protein lerEdw1_009567 [Lerista edwardsae]
MKVFLCVFLLLVLPSAATCLKCVLCLNDEETCRNTTNQECKPEEDTCISGVTEIFLGEDRENITSSYKACFPSKKCQPGYFSTTLGNNMYSRSNVSCCQTDLCNGEDVQLPPRNATLNGLKCPMCISNTSDHCHAKETVGCTHDEDRCLTFSQSTKAGESLPLAVHNPGSFLTPPPLSPPNHCTASAKTETARPAREHIADEWGCRDHNQTVSLQGCSTENTCATQKGVIELADGWYVQNITQVDCQPAREQPPIKE